MIKGPETMLCLWPFVLDISISFHHIEIVFVGSIDAAKPPKQRASVFCDAVSLLFLFLGKEEL
ncbi:hypothetical protein [Neobacillus drentensis]|uniref:hypothetical protein n=1 Tax=Neobacillus drentensis TaxID=220684 RepID=UPI002FFFCCB7